jgi:uncharacterized glyoxalase superfamily protein PhnB
VATKARLSHARYRLVMPDATTFMGVHLAVADMAATMAFYRLAGLPIAADAGAQEHVEIELDGGVHLAFSTPAVMAMYDPAWRGPAASTATALQFGLPSRAAVDEMYASLTGAGYHGHLPPFDAFWGNRYCEVDDPDGNTVGFHSQTDPSTRT